MLDTLRRRFWLWLLGPVAYEGAVKAHTDCLLDYAYRAQRTMSRSAKSFYRTASRESARALRRLGLSQWEVDCIRARARLLPNRPDATAIFLNDQLVGFSNDWHATAPLAGPNALHIHTTRGGLS